MAGRIVSELTPEPEAFEWYNDPSAPAGFFWDVQAVSEARGAPHLCGGPNCTEDCGPDFYDGGEEWDNT
jgi:hypothetical protein